MGSDDLDIWFNLFWTGDFPASRSGSDRYTIHVRPRTGQCLVEVTKVELNGSGYK